MRSSKLLLLATVLVFNTAIHAQNANPAIIPEPVSVTWGKGRFELPANVVVQAPLDSGMKGVFNVLFERMARSTGSKIVVNNSAAQPTIRFVLNNNANEQLGAEGYQLKVTEKQVVITANQAAGLYYGVQTLMQLFPPEIESATKVNGVRWTAPVTDITDYPRFGWRGLMFDVARHFFTKEEVKKFIDNMVRYKYNLLHLHLTDDEGWRIEIKGLPRLTEVGAWRVNKTGYFGTFSPPTPDEPRDYGGFYTHDDIRELVQYAKERFVNIMPEVDVPGHSLAAVVAYPELSCTPGVEKYNVRSGEVIMDWSRGQPPIALVDNTLCPANEKVYEFLDKVMTQIAELFPFEYIHVGGDECPKNFWEKNPQVQELMRREGLKTMPEVQAYFEKRLEKIVLAKGKKFLGWDEILEGGIAPTAAVMSWQGMKGGIHAAKLGHDVVMTPTTYAYIDYMQGDAAIEPKVYASLRLNKSYEFEPVPDSIDAKYIKGVQANLWTEQIYTLRHAEYMTWPRGFAIAEKAWSQKDKKNWERFFGSVEQHFQRLDMAGIKYAPSAYEPIITVTRTSDNRPKVELASEVSGIDIHYTFDNSFPDQFYPKYTSALVPPKDAVQLRMVSYKAGKQVGRIITIPVAELQARAAKAK